jgi:hypothetical protein
MRVRPALTLLILALALSACTRDQITAGLFGGAKNWCRHASGCHVDGKLTP